MAGLNAPSTHTTGSPGAILGDKAGGQWPAILGRWTPHLPLIFQGDDMAIVINKTAAPHTFARSANKKEASASMELLTLYPGANDLQGDKEKSLEWAREIPDYKEMVEAKTLVEVVEQAEKEGEKGKKLAALPQTLKDLDLTMANELVGATVDLGILNGWKRSESRQSVITALEKQIEIVKDLEKRADDAKA